MKRLRPARTVYRAGLVLVLATSVVVTSASTASAAAYKHGAGWALDRLDQVQRQPDDNSFRWEDGLSGAGVTIYVLSDFIEGIPELAGRVESGLRFGGGAPGVPDLTPCAPEQDRPIG